MIRFSVAILMGAASAVWGAGSPFDGRWDLTVTPKTGASYPDWMELAEKDGATTMRIQPRSGGAFPVTDFKVAGSHLTVNWPHRDAKSPATIWELDITEDRLSGTEQRGGQVAAYLAGLRAPAPGIRDESQ